MSRGADSVKSILCGLSAIAIANVVEAGFRRWCPNVRWLFFAPAHIA